MLNKVTDNFSKTRLDKYRLPVIRSINELLELLDLKNRESYFFYSKNRSRFLYHEFNIKKRNGGERTIETPSSEVRPILNAIGEVFFSKFHLDECCNGFVKGRSILTNAAPHIGAKTLFKFDIKDFFPSINMKKLFYLFRFYGYGTNVSKYLCFLCLNKNLTLPQGSPISPVISNLIAVRLDARIKGFCSRHSDLCLSYTRYADDITVSSKNKLGEADIKRIQATIYSIIEDCGFMPNKEKCKVYKQGMRLEVTGINVNHIQIPHVNKRYIREVEISLYCIEKYSLDSHLKYYNEKYNTTFSKEKYISHLLGVINFINMVDSQKAKTFRKKLDFLAKEYYV